MKTPLRYPGGKSRAVKHILPYIPEDISRLCSPFFGGGSVELAVASRGTEVIGYDKLVPLVWFWQALCADNERLADEADTLRQHHPDFVLKGKPVRGLIKEDFIKLREELRDSSFMFSYEKAAKFYAINRASFSGATFSGGWSKRASYARFTQSSIDRLRRFNAENFRVDYADFQTSLPWHPRAFLYLDPPYLLPEDAAMLYGQAGALHAGFNHMALYNLLSDRSDWVMSYNDCPEVRDLYSNRKIVTAEWAYGMKNVEWVDGKCVGKKTMGSSSELLIIG